MLAGEQFGLERTRGTLRARFAVRDGRTFPLEAYQSGAARIRFPRVERGQPLEAALINTAGGLTGGDRLSASVALDTDARVIVTSQACEKIYRSNGDDARVRTEISLGSRACLDWLPQPTILFDGAQLRRETTVDMEADAGIILLEASVLGRTAMRETMNQGKLVDHWRIRRDGRLIYADTIALEGGIRARYASPWALGVFRAYAALVCVSPDVETRLGEIRDVLAELPGRAAASVWNGLLSVRFVADDGYALLACLAPVLKTLRRAPLPRLWAI